MAEPMSRTKIFEQTLEAGATVDDLFKDTGPTLGSDPFLENERVGSSHPIMHLQQQEQPIETKLQDGLILINRKFHALAALTDLIAKECSYQDFMQRILEVFAEAVPSERGSLLEVNYQQDRNLFFRSVCNHAADGLFNVTIPWGQGVVGFVADQQVPLLLSNVDESAMFLSTVQHMVGFEARNMVAFPLVVRGKTFGVIELFNRKDSAKYSSEDLEIIQSLACLAVRLIENRLVMAALAKNLTRSEAA